MTTWQVSLKLLWYFVQSDNLMLMTFAFPQSKEKPNKKRSVLKQVLTSKTILFNDNCISLARKKLMNLFQLGCETTVLKTYMYINYFWHFIPDRIHGLEVWVKRPLRPFLLSSVSQIGFIGTISTYLVWRDRGSNSRPPALEADDLLLHYRCL